MTHTDRDPEHTYVQRFKKLYQDQHGKQLSDDEALAYFRSLVELVRSVYRPIPLSKAKELERLLSSLANRRGR